MRAAHPSSLSVIVNIFVGPVACRGAFVVIDSASC